MYADKLTQLPKNNSTRMTQSRPEHASSDLPSSAALEAARHRWAAPTAPAEPHEVPRPSQHHAARPVDPTEENSISLRGPQLEKKSPAKRIWIKEFLKIGGTMLTRLRKASGHARVWGHIQGTTRCRLRGCSTCAHPVKSHGLTHLQEALRRLDLILTGEENQDITVALVKVNLQSRGSSETLRRWSR